MQENQSNLKKNLNQQSPFVLPDGRFITNKMLDIYRDAVFDRTPIEYYLKLDDLVLISVPYSDVNRLEQINYGEEDKFVKLPRADEGELRKLMYEALEIMKFPIDGEFSDDEKFANDKLESLLAKQHLTVSEIENEMNNEHATLMGAWDQGKADYLWDVVSDWLSTSPINANDNNDYWFSDDCCEVCKYMKATEDGWIYSTGLGLREAFRRQNNKDGESNNE